MNTGITQKNKQANKQIHASHKSSGKLCGSSYFWIQPSFAPLKTSQSVHYRKCRGFWSSKILCTLFCSSIQARFRKMKPILLFEIRLKILGEQFGGRVWQFCLSLAISLLKWRGGEGLKLQIQGCAGF